MRPPAAEAALFDESSPDPSGFGDEPEKGALLLMAAPGAGNDASAPVGPLPAGRQGKGALAETEDSGPRLGMAGWQIIGGFAGFSESSLKTRC